MESRNRPGFPRDNKAHPGPVDRRRGTLPPMAGARRFPSRRPRNHFSVIAFLALAALLFFPAIGIRRLCLLFDARLVLGYAAFVSAVAFFMNRVDKLSAKLQQWRTPESTLHFLELLGGWPGTFVAQRSYRHKVRKTSYQVQFWLIVALHEFHAFDFVQDWSWSQQLLQPFSGT